MSKQKTTKARAKAEINEWNFYLANGDWFARIYFRNAAQVRRLFPRCRIKGDCVYLAQP